MPGTPVRKETVAVTLLVVLCLGLAVVCVVLAGWIASLHGAARQITRELQEKLELDTNTLISLN